MSHFNLSMRALSPFFTWELVEMRVEDGYNSLSDATLLCFTTDNYIDLKSLVGTPIQWHVTTGYVASRYFVGIIESIETFEQQPDSHSTSRYFTIKVCNMLAQLTHNSNNRSWCNQDIQSIIQDVFTDYQINFDFSACNNSYPKLNYVVQYNQSDFDFLQVLCHEHGLAYHIAINPQLSQCDQSILTSTDYIIYFMDHRGAYDLKQYTVRWPNTTNQSAQWQANTMRAITAQNHVVPNQFNSNDYYPLAVNARLNQALQTDNNDNDCIGPISEFPNNTLTYDPNAKQIHQQAQQHVEHAEQISFYTADLDLRLGGTLDIQGMPGAGFGEMQSNQLLPIKIIHEAKAHGNHIHSGMQAPTTILKDSVFKGTQGGYSNHITCLPWAMQFYYPPLNPRHKGKIPSTCIATVVADSYDSIVADKFGRVKICFPWDQNNTGDYISSYPWARIIHNQNGYQFTPHVGDECVVSFENNRMDRPIIIGSLYNGNTPLPFATKAKPALSGIKVAKDINADPHFYYHDNTLHAEHIMLKSAGDLHKSVGNKLDKKLATYLQDISHSLQHYVKGDMTVGIEDEALHITAKQGIAFEVDGTKVELQPDCINLIGQDITLNTPDGLTGNLVNVGSAHSCNRHNGGPVSTGSSNVFFSDKPAVRVGDKAKCHGFTDTIKKGNSGITINGQHAAVVHSKTAHDGKVTSGASHISAGKTQASGSAAATKIVNNDVTLLFKLAATGGYEPVIAHAVVNLHALPDASGKTTHLDHTNIPTHQLNGKTTIHDVAGGQYDCSLSPHARELAIYDVNGTPCFPYYRARINVPGSPNNGPDKTDKARQYDAKILWPMMVLNCRAKGHGYEEAKAQGAFDHIDPLDIKYFQENGNNVTVFIHGYNVDAGELGNEYSHVEPIKPTPMPLFASKFDRITIAEQNAKQAESKNPQDHLRLVPTAYKSSIWRDTKLLSGQIEYNLPHNFYSDADTSDSALNGEGAFNWFINMEKNLNSAAGMNAIHPDSYNKFTRTLHVTWSGDWGNILYGEAVDEALSKAPAARLAHTLSRLKKADLEVNIIAHSLGNGFLLETLKILHHVYPDVEINHAFMWDAAVPNDVFCRPAPKHNQIDRWDFKDALKAVAKITALYSANDNILGPLPSKSDQTAKLQDVYASKPLLEFVPAYACEAFQLQSIYNIAMALSVETHTIIDPTVQQHVYRYLLRNHTELIDVDNTDPNPKQLSPGKKYLPTLKQQLAYIKNQDDYAKLQKQLTDGLKQIDQDWHNPDSHLSHYFKVNPQYKHYVTDAINTGEEVNTTWFHILTRLMASECPAGAATMYGLEGIGQLIFNHFNCLGACYLIHMLDDRELEVWHTDAMGYKLPPMNMQHKIGSKVEYINQTQWLYQHSGMKIPSDDLMTNIIKPKIYNKLKPFGRYS